MYVCIYAVPLYSGVVRLDAQPKLLIVVIEHLTVLLGYIETISVTDYSRTLETKLVNGPAPFHYQYYATAINKCSCSEPFMSCVF